MYKRLGLASKTSENGKRYLNFSFTAKKVRKSNLCTHKSRFYVRKLGSFTGSQYVIELTSLMNLQRTLAVCCYFAVILSISLFNQDKSTIDISENMKKKNGRKHIHKYSNIKIDVFHLFLLLVRRNVGRQRWQINSIFQNCLAMVLQKNMIHKF